MKRLIVDLDETITVSAEEGYAKAIPNRELIARLADYRSRGFAVVIHTSRNMNTFSGNLGMINVHTLPVILAWLSEHDVPFDEVHVGKPWCGREGFHVDDRAIRPSEFLKYSIDEITALLAAEKQVA